MKQMIILIALVFAVGLVQAQSVMDIAASDGMLNEIIGADTLSDGTQAHDVYRLTTLDMTYKFTDAINAKGDISIIGVPDATDGRPPCIQPAVRQDNSIAPTFLTVTASGAKVKLQHLYLLAYAPNNAANGGGVAIMVNGDEVRLTVDLCVFDGWQTFGIGYNGQWDDFYLTKNHFRNFVHPNQHYIGEVIRNTWPGEAYTDTLSMIGNTMLCVNGYASCPVTKYYESYFEFSQNKVLYTFKNPFFIFNVTDAKINDNIFYGLYAGGVDTLENPWWDNLWNPDTTYGIIALQPLSGDNALMFMPEDSAGAEAARRVQVNNNQYFWPTELTDFWANWNATQANTVRLPGFMNEPTEAMFADDAAYPYLEASGNVEADPGFMTSLNDHILNGSDIDYTIGLLAYFEQIRTGTAATDYWGYEMTYVDGTANWVPIWPLPEYSALPTSIRDEMATLLPSQFAINSVYPNPFNPTTNVEFTLANAGKTAVDVYNVLGQHVLTVVDNQYLQAGSYDRTIDMTGLTSGTYFVVLKQDASRSVRKMLFLK
jgi:hypothetical protein